MINEAKLRCKLKLLVYPAVVINYGNPNILIDFDNNRQKVPIYSFNENIYSDRDGGASSVSMPYNSQLNRSMPDLAIQKNQQQSNGTGTIYNTTKSSIFSNSNNNNIDSIQQQQQQNYKDKLFGTSLPITITKSSTNLTSNDIQNDYTQNDSSGAHHFLIENIDKLAQPQELRPVPRLCTIYKNEGSHSNYSTYSSPITSNIGFGVQQKNNSTNSYLRVNIVSSKSPAHLAGVEIGDQIIEVNGRNTLDMTPDEILHFIKVL